MKAIFSSAGTATGMQVKLKKFLWHCSRFLLSLKANLYLTPNRNTELMPQLGCETDTVQMIYKLTTELLL